MSWRAIPLILSFALALGPLRASPQASVQHHYYWVLIWWVPSIALLALGIMRKLRSRWVVLLAAGLIYVAVYLVHPVCDEIPPAIQSSFETVRTLEERASSGEPFRRLDGTWYQCKSWLSRQLFF